MTSNPQPLAQDDLREAVLAAAARAEVSEATAQIYEELGQETARRRPICVLSGRCCRFEEYGYRLFVTTIELASFVKSLQERPIPVGQSTWNGRGCPFQIGVGCGVHEIRPFGCRVFFCDATSQAWQEEQYQQFHQRLRHLHEILEVPYYYVEWREALGRVLALGPA